MQLQFQLQVQAATSDEQLTSVINTVDPITCEDGVSVLTAAGVSTLMNCAKVPNAVRRLVKYYSLGICR